MPTVGCPGSRSPGCASLVNNASPGAMREGRAKGSELRVEGCLSGNGSCESQSWSWASNFQKEALVSWLKPGLQTSSPAQGRKAPSGVARVGAAPGQEPTTATVALVTA